MSRITHFKSQPINIQYWDYYILCRLNAEAALTLQRMEFWDGTKDAGNSHAEDINDMQALSGETPTQDVSAWVYKSQDELHWELMGIVGEKRVKDLFKVLEKDLGYIKVRNNPYKGWDRKKQYEFEAGLVQSHINYLGYIVSFFGLPLRRLRPIFYAIEALTRNEIYIEQLSVELVIKKISEFREDPKLPHFLKNDLEKLGELSMKQPLRSFGNFAEWKAQNCGMQSAESPNASRKTADSIPQKRGSNSIEYKTENTKQRRQREDRKNGTSQQSATVSTQQESFHSFDHSSSSSSKKSSSQGTKREKKPEVIFPPEAEQVYQLLADLNITCLKKDEAHRDNCIHLVSKGMTTVEKLESLMQSCWQLSHLKGKALNLKNLINALPGWLQMQQSVATTLPSIGTRVISSYDDDDFVDDTFYEVKVTDKELAEDIRKTVHFYNADDRYEECLEQIVSFKQAAMLSNYKMYEKIVSTCGSVSPDRYGIDTFLEKLQRIVM